MNGDADGCVPTDCTPAWGATGGRGGVGWFEPTAGFCCGPTLIGVGAPAVVPAALAFAIFRATLPVMSLPKLALDGLSKNFPAEQSDQGKKNQAAADVHVAETAAREVDWSAESDDEPKQHEYPEQKAHCHLILLRDL